jgi:hypothetical protein
VATPWRRNLAAAREAKALTASAISSCVRNAWTQHLPYRRWRGMAGPLSNSLCAGSMPPDPRQHLSGTPGKASRGHSAASIHC